MLLTPVWMPPRWSCHYCMWLCVTDCLVTCHCCVKCTYWHSLLVWGIRHQRFSSAQNGITGTCHAFCYRWIWNTVSSILCVLWHISLTCAIFQNVTSFSILKITQTILLATNGRQYQSKQVRENWMCWQHQDEPMAQKSSVCKLENECWSSCLHTEISGAISYSYLHLKYCKFALQVVLDVVTLPSIPQLIGGIP